MRNKVLLIRPANVYNYNNYPPLNLILLASVLREHGFETQIINSAFEEDISDKIKNCIDDLLFVGITLLTPEIPDGLKIMETIRRHSDVPIVAGGWHCTLFPEQMADSNYVDYVVVGEGEEHIVEIARLLKEGKRPEEKIFARKMLDMNELPVPDYSLEPSIEKFIQSYLTDALSRYVRQPMRWLPYESSRGCPSECTFCINVVSGNMKYRKKSAEKVISELEHIIKKYQLTHVKFIDDNFFVDIKRVRDICQGILDKGLDITWDAECRCDYFNDRILNDETLELAKKSGLVQLTLGIESGSQKTLDIMRKHITVEQAENAVAKCNQFGILARSSFILEIPGEEKEDIVKTIKFINRLRKYPSFSCGVGTFRPYPKCELTEELITKGYLKEPRNLEEWNSPDVINMYTAGEYIRPWQVDGNFSFSASYYLNIESAIRLGSNQIDSFIDRLKNELYIKIAKYRNRFIFYRFPVDRDMYKKFLEGHYRRVGALDKKKS